IQPLPRRWRRIDKAWVLTYRSPSRFASAMADGVAPFRDFPVGLACELPFAPALAELDSPRIEGAVVAPRYILVALQTYESDVHTPTPSRKFLASPTLRWLAGRLAEAFRSRCSPARELRSRYPR